MSGGDDDTRRSLMNATLINRSPRFVDRSKYEELERIENMVKKMQSQQCGVKIQDVSPIIGKKMENVFSGYDMIEWLMANLKLGDVQEAKHLGTMILAHGYFYPINKNVSKLTVMKDDFYRFQDPMLWPTEISEPGDKAYAVYLWTRWTINNSKLTEHEKKNLWRLRDSMRGNWHEVQNSAEITVKLLTHKNEKYALSTYMGQMRAFWNIYRPPPGHVPVLDLNLIKPRRCAATLDDQSQLTWKSAKEKRTCGCSSDLQAQIKEHSDKLKKISLVTGSHIRESICNSVTETIASDELVKSLDPKQMYVGKAAHSHSSVYSLLKLKFDRLLKDPNGRREFRLFLQKEHSVENLDFWMACKEFKFEALGSLPALATKILEQYIHSNVVNIDAQTRKEIMRALKSDKLDRYCLDDVRAQIFDLMKNDSFTRFMTTEQYMKVMEVKAPTFDWRG